MRSHPNTSFRWQINEVRAVLDWLQAHGPDHGLDSARLGIGGDSAGANLAVSVTQLCHQQSPGLIQFLLLYYGAYGLTESASWQQYGNAEFEFTREEKEFYLTSYLGEAHDRNDPRFNVLKGDIGLLPQRFHRSSRMRPATG